ncbi:MAG: hypothetical protein J3K34DRAFT_415847 [Monoraphidium minutum]|nr:MAG: hypothetical protein J3K34DRAFT_415847 [Monoraphidium minutum]
MGPRARRGRGGPCPRARRRVMRVLLLLLPLLGLRAWDRCAASRLPGLALVTSQPWSPAVPLVPEAGVLQVVGKLRLFVPPLRKEIHFRIFNAP